MPRRAASFFSDDQDSSEPSQPNRTETQIRHETSLKSSKKLKKYSKDDQVNPSLSDKHNSEIKQISHLHIEQPVQLSEQSIKDKSIPVRNVDELVDTSKTIKSHKKEKHDADHSKKKKKRAKSVSKHSKHKTHAADSTGVEATLKPPSGSERKHRHSHRSKDPTKSSHISAKSHAVRPVRDASHEHYEEEAATNSQKLSHVSTHKSSGHHFTSLPSASPPSHGGSQDSHSSCETLAAVPQHPSQRISEELQRDEASKPSRSRKHRSDKSSHSPPVHHSHKSEVSLNRPSTNDYPLAEEKILQSSVSYAKRSRSPTERSPLKTRRYDSHTLSYGYRQEAHRQYSSSRYKSRSRHHRDRSRSPSPRRVSKTRTPTRHSEQEYSHSKVTAKPKSRTYAAIENYESSSRSSRKVHRSVVSKHPKKSCSKESKSERASASPPHKSSSRAKIYGAQHNEDRTKHTSRSNSRGHSHSHPDSRREKRTVDHSTHPDQPQLDKSTPNHVSHTEPVSCHSRSPSPKEKPDKKRKSESLDALISLLTELDTEEVSDTELSAILPSALFTNQIVQRDFDSKNTLKPESPIVMKDTALPNVTPTNADLQKEQENFTPENNEATALETLEKLSSQVRKHLAEPETWDLNELNIPCEMDEDQTDLTVNPSVVNLASRKAVPQQRLSTMLASICTPWQELIDSATKNLNDASLKSDPDSSLQPLGALLENSNGSFVPLHKRANGLEALRLTGISKDYLGQELIDELCNQYSDLTDSISTQSPLAWIHRSSLIHPCCSLELSQFGNHSGPKVFGNKLNMCVPFGARLDLAIRQNVLGLTNS